MWQAVEAGADIETIVTAPTLLAGSPAADLVASQRAAGVAVAELTADLFSRLSNRDGPSGLAAIINGHLGRLDALEVPVDGFMVALHEVANPGNLGTIIRTADGFGAAGLILVGNSADPYAPAAVKASMGSLFHLPLVRGDSLASFFDWAVSSGVHTLTTSARASTPLAAMALEPPVAILLGSERVGLPTDALGRGAQQVRIPMVGHATSLNLSVAAGILMYEVRRRLAR